MAAVNHYMTEEERTRHEAKMRFRAFELPHMSREERDERLVELVGETHLVEHLRYENGRLERLVADAQSSSDRTQAELSDIRHRVDVICEGLEDWGHPELGEKLRDAILSNHRPIDYGLMKELEEAVCTTEG